MISYLSGILTGKAEQHLILETGGVGYFISVSPILLASLPPIGEKIKIFTHMSVKEDGISLFGFRTMEELDLFHQLITVSGVGPKAGLGFLATMTPEEIIVAILSGDAATLSKTPGVGAKTAQRVILELKDKVKTEQIFLQELEASTMKNGSKNLENSAKFEAIEALTSLGYSRSEAAKAVSMVYKEKISTEELLKQALKKMI